MRCGMKKKNVLTGLLLFFCITGAVLVFCDFGGKEKTLPDANLGESVQAGALQSEEKKEQKTSGETTDPANRAEEADSDSGGEKSEKHSDNGKKTVLEPLLETEDSAGRAENERAGNAAESEENTYTVFQDALFIGDSRTEGLSLYSGITNADFFGAKSLSIDRILNGERVGSGKNKRTIYEQLTLKNYSKVYISLGLNELGWVYIDRFTEDYETLIREIQKDQPNAVIYVQALIPVTAEKSERDTVENNNQIYWYNTHLVTVAENTGAVYLNADQPLIGDDGALLPDATTDGVHFKSEYCKLWAARIAELSE